MGRLSSQQPFRKPDSYLTEAELASQRPKTGVAVQAISPGRAASLGPWHLFTLLRKGQMPFIKKRTLIIFPLSCCFPLLFQWENGKQNVSALMGWFQNPKYFHFFHLVGNFKEILQINSANIFVFLKRSFVRVRRSCPLSNEFLYVHSLHTCFFAGPILALAASSLRTQTKHFSLPLPMPYGFLAFVCHVCHRVESHSD